MEINWRFPDSIARIQCGDGDATTAMDYLMSTIDALNKRLNTEGLPEEQLNAVEDAIEFGFGFHSHLQELREDMWEVGKLYSEYCELLNAAIPPQPQE